MPLPILPRIPVRSLREGHSMRLYSYWSFSVPTQSCMVTTSGGRLRQGEIKLPSAALDPLVQKDTVVPDRPDCRPGKADIALIRFGPQHPIGLAADLPAGGDVGSIGVLKRLDDVEFQVGDLGLEPDDPIV